MIAETRYNHQQHQPQQQQQQTTQLHYHNKKTPKEGVVGGVGGTGFGIAVDSLLDGNGSMGSSTSLSSFGSSLTSIGSSGSAGNNSHTHSISLLSRPSNLLEAIVEWGGAECETTTAISNTIGRLFTSSGTTVSAVSPASSGGINSPNRASTVHGRRQNQNLPNEDQQQQQQQQQQQLPPQFSRGRGVLRSRSGANSVITHSVSPTRGACGTRKNSSTSNTNLVGLGIQRTRSGNTKTGSASTKSPNGNNSNSNLASMITTTPTNTTSSTNHDISNGSNSGISGVSTTKKTVSLLLLTAAVCCFNIYTSFGGTSNTTILATTAPMFNSNDNSNINTSSSNIGNDRSLNLVTIGGKNAQSTTHQSATSSSNSSFHPVVRVLAGIFTTESYKDQQYRNVFRALLETQYPRVCTLRDFLSMVNSSSNSNSNSNSNTELDSGYCELIYTFVIGSNPDGPTEIIDNHTHPILFETGSLAMSVNGHGDGNGTNINNSSNHSNNNNENIDTTVSISLANDLDSSDITRLNIRENMNDGKSQTWLYYASTVARAVFDSNRKKNTNTSPLVTIDYIVKMDTDSVLYLDRWFTFVRKSLIPTPYNYRTVGGTIVDKVWWNLTKQHQKKTESFYYEKFQSMHLYLAGQFYIISSDLASDIASFLSLTNQASKTSAITTPSTEDGERQTANTTVIPENIDVNARDITSADENINPYVAKAREWTEHHEDHDVTLFANLATGHEPDRPIKFIFIPVSDPFWRHNVKIKKQINPNEIDEEWKAIWDNEIERITKVFKSTKTTKTRGKISSSSATEDQPIGTAGKLNLINQDGDLIITDTDSLTIDNEIDPGVGTSSNLRRNNNIGRSNEGSKTFSKWLASIIGRTMKSRSSSTIEKAGSGVDAYDETDAKGALTTDSDVSLLDYLKIAHPDLFLLTSSSSSTSSAAAITVTPSNNTLFHTLLNLAEFVEVTNGIGDNRDCFISASKGGYLDRPMKIVHFNAESGVYYNELAQLIRSSQQGLEMPDVVLLNEMDYNITIGIAQPPESPNSIQQIHATEQLAKLLMMNFAWAIESVKVSSTVSAEKSKTSNKKVEVERTISFRGNAILSKCPLYQPAIIRDADTVQYTTYTSTSNASTTIETIEYYFGDGNKKDRHDKVIPSGMGLFARTGHLKVNHNNIPSDNEDSTNESRNSYIVTGSVHFLYNFTNSREAAWEYMFNRTAPPDSSQDDASPKVGTPPKDHIGAVVTGDTRLGLCRSIGLYDFNRYGKLTTYPTDCSANTFGSKSRVNVCSNIPLYKRFKDNIHMPCFQKQNGTDTSTTITTGSTNTTATTTIQLSNHGIIAMMFH